MNPFGIPTTEVDSDQPVTVTLTALEALLVGTQLLQQAKRIIDACTDPQTCKFCTTVGMSQQETALKFILAVNEAGKSIPPDHTPN